MQVPTIWQVIYVQKLEAKPKRGGDRSEFEYAHDVKGELEWFAVFTSDVPVAPVTLMKGRIALRSSARTQTRDESRVVWKLAAAERERTRSALPLLY